MVGLSIIVYSDTIEAKWPRWIKEIGKLIQQPTAQDTCPPAIEGAITDNITARLKERLGQPDKNTIDDASCLNKTNVFAIVQPTKESQIKEVINFARAHDKHISIAAVRHSMGGQTFYPDSIIIDMTKYNKMLSLDHVKKIAHVQSGITWATIQDHVDDYNLSIRAMQSTNIFSVGGSMSVNAHGMDHKAGSVAQTVLAFRIMMADGSVKNVTQANDPELFELVLGGYGLFGIILDAQIGLTENVAYMPKIKFVKTTLLAQNLNNILGNPNIGIFYAHLSTSPYSMLNDALLYQYEFQTFTSKIPHLGQARHTRFKRLILNLAKKREYGRHLKWFLEKHIERFMQQCKHPILKYKCLISRNELMNDSVPYLQHALLNSVDILQEYFIPAKNLDNFINVLRQLVRQYNINLLNVSIRIVHKEDIFLNYAPTPRVAVVLYFNQKRNDSDVKKITTFTQALINSTLKLNGTFFLPYQLYYTRNQLKHSYPMIDKFFAFKRKYDPNLLFMNEFYSKYAE